MLLRHSAPFITVTGLDRVESVRSLIPLDCEVGLLYTADPSGRPRYPSIPDLFGIIRELGNHVPRVALHVCGGEGRQRLLNGELMLARGVHRIQVNGTLDVDVVERICALYPLQTIITQHTTANRELVSHVEAPNHALLIDASGGRGRSPAAWELVETDKAVGFAGGLGPDNLAAELSRIAEVARPGWWVDMENKLRVGDWFSPDLARAAVNVFHSSVGQPAAQPAL